VSPLLAASCGSCGRSESARVGVALRSACPDGGACPSPAGNVIRCRSAFCCCLPQSSARKGARGAKHRNRLSRSGEDGLRIAPLRQPASDLHLRPDQKHTGRSQIDSSGNTGQCWRDWKKVVAAFIPCPGVLLFAFLRPLARSRGRNLCGPYGGLPTRGDGLPPRRGMPRYDLRSSEHVLAPACHGGAASCGSRSELSTESPLRFDLGTRE
jgi:hypothetical protein